MKRWLLLVLRLIVVALLSALAPGCDVLGLGATGSAGATSGGDTATYDLPDVCFQAPLLAPDVQRAPWPKYTLDQQNRQVEVCKYQAGQYEAEGWVVVVTKQTYLGTIIDCLDAASVPNANVQPPPPIPAAELVPAPGYQLQPDETDGHPELQCPDGTIGWEREPFSAYVFGGTGATSLDDWIQNYQVLGAPSKTNRLYAGLRVVADNIGATAWVSGFAGEIEDGTLSILEMIVVCGKQYVGVAIGRDRANRIRGMPGDSVLRLKVEFVTTKPNTLYGWDGVFAGFRPVIGYRPYGPGKTIIPSTIGGQQHESRLDIRLWNGDWWIAHDGNWLGRYPSSLFEQTPSFPSQSACEVQWYGEVYDPTPAQWTWTDMGSGKFSNAGPGNAAYFRRPTYLDTFAIVQQPTLNSTMNVPGINPACYDNSYLNPGVPPWDQFFTLGGPGGDDTNCANSNAP